MALLCGRERVMQACRQLTIVMLCVLVTATSRSDADESGGRLRATAPQPVAQAEALVDDARPSKADPLAVLDARWQVAVEPLARRAEAVDHEQLAAAVRGWRVRAVPPADGRQLIYRIPATSTTPAWVRAAKPPVQAVWEDFRAARHRWAGEVYQAAREAANAEQGCEAMRLLGVTLAADPDHEQAREAGGWVRRVEDGGTTWLWPEAARRQSRREVYSPEFGWLSKTWHDRYADGQRRAGTRWVSKDELPAPSKLADAAIWQSDHWRISQLGDEAAAARLAARLEETHAVWWQAFGSFAMERGELERRFNGQFRARPSTSSMQAVQFASRQQYIDTLERLEPQIGRTLGIYWMPTQTSYFFEDDDVDATTVFHEAVHQLFAESRRTSRLAGEENGFWVLEAVACYMESLEATEQGWRLGGLDHGRAPMAVERLTLDGFYVPLETLCRLGRVDFQAHPQLPPLYSQISGLADFFMNAQQGRYREAFMTYLQRVYTGSARADSLAQLCGADFEQLDAEYRRHLSR